MTKNKIVAILAVTLFFFVASPVHARKVIPRTVASASSKSGSSAGKLGMLVKFRGDRRAVNVTFTNVASVTSINYTLSYVGSGLSQGAGGSVDTSLGGTIVRELLFGSCSSGVCRYDTGVANAKLLVTYVTGGRKYAKTFRLKV